MTDQSALTRAESEITLFLSQWERQPDGCLPFKGEHSPEGRPIVRTKTSEISATHLRWAIITRSPLPKGWCLLPTCGKKDCGEIGHLLAIDRTDLARRLNADRWGDEQDRWEASCDRDSVPGCVLWRGDTPYFRGKGRVVTARRYAFEQAYPGMLSGGDLLRRTCRTTNCIEPAHMERVTRSENALRNNAGRWGDEKARFEAKIFCDPKTGCEIWTGSCFSFRPQNGRSGSPRKYAYEKHFEVALSSDDVVRPRASCDDMCVNPRHMERISWAEHGRRNRAEQMERDRAAL